MFDSVLRRGALPKRRFGSGAVIAVLMHVGVLVFALWASSRALESKKQDLTVTFVKPPPPPPPPAPKHARPKPKPDQPQTVVQQAIVAPTVIPEEKPPEQEPTNEHAAGEGVEGGDVAGVPGGIVGGVVDASDARVEFNETMAPPNYISGPEPRYTEKALEHEVQGLMVVKCVVTVQGVVHDCRVIRSLPFMDRAVIEALERRRYTPATLKGKPLEVDYTFKIRLNLPH